MKRRLYWAITPCKMMFIPVIFLYFFIIGPPAAEGHQGENAEVLVLSSYHQGFCWSDNMIEGIKSVFGDGKENIGFHIEYMDTKRRSDDIYYNQLYELYKNKFTKDEFKVIISCDNPAFSFLLKYRNALFPGVPVVFCGVNNYHDTVVDGQKNITGVVEGVDVAATIETILKIQPATRQINVINDTTETGLAIKQSLLELSGRYAGQISFNFLEGLDIKEVQEEVQKLPDNSVVLLLPFNRDKSGNVISCQDYRFIADKSKVPIYGCWDCDLGNGIVGGMLSSGYTQGETAANMAGRILQGENADHIPIIKISPNRYMFDYNQMKRFNIEISDLPEGSIVINKPYAAFTKYKYQIIGATVSVLVLIIIILFLAVNILKRKRAEADLIQIKNNLELKVAERTHKLLETIEELHCIQSVIRERDKLTIVGQMAAGMAHEIKNPLTAVKGFAQLLKEKCTDSGLVEYAAIIQEEAEQANRVIADFLQLARPKQPSLKVQSVDGLVRETLSIVEPKAFLDNIRVEYQSHQDLPECLLDKDQIKQVLINILKNAIEAMPTGGTIKIRTGLLPEANEIYIDIQDNGLGIPPERLEDIGVPFFTTKDSGTGLGLSISYAIIDAHGGRIEVDSKENRGTTFRIILPGYSG